jgi:uncharacterized protein (TIGR04222 family)
MYVALLVGGLALFLLTRAAVLRVRTRRRGLSLHPAEVAYLVAGPEHALLVAGVDLHDAGLLRPVSRQQGVRMTREQVLQLAPSGCAVDEAATPELPLERAVVRALAAEPGRPVADKRLHTAPEMTELRAHLNELGLIVDGRRAWLVRLSALWPILVLSFGLIRLDAGIRGPEAWLSVLAAVAVTTAGIWFGVPRQTPAARRVVLRAEAHRQDVAERLVKRVASVGFGTDNPELREAGVDPLVVAAHGSIVLWSADPLLAAALGAIPPRWGKHGLLHANAPLDDSSFVGYGSLADIADGPY